MKTCFLILSLVLLAQTATADESIVMTNGMTCWRNAHGVIYGCSGGVDTGGSGFNDARTGTRYEYINDHQAVNTKTGQVINVPRRQRQNKKQKTSLTTNPYTNKVSGTIAVIPGDQKDYYEAHPEERVKDAAVQANKPLADMRQKLIDDIKARKQEFGEGDYKDYPKTSSPPPPPATPPPSLRIGVRGGVIDTTTGEFSPQVKGGAINPRTGEFLPDVGKGYIDPKTGEFIPKK